MKYAAMLSVFLSGMLWGVELDFAIYVVDRLVDWVHTDDIKTGSSGSENFDYTKNGLREPPYNKRFHSLD